MPARLESEAVCLIPGSKEGLAVLPWKMAVLHVPEPMEVYDLVPDQEAVILIPESKENDLGPGQEGIMMICLSTFAEGL